MSTFQAISRTTVESTSTIVSTDQSRVLMTTDCLIGTAQTISLMKQENREEVLETLDH